MSGRVNPGVEWELYLKMTPGLCSLERKALVSEVCELAKIVGRSDARLEDDGWTRVDLQYRPGLSSDEFMQLLGDIHRITVLMGCRVGYLRQRQKPR